MILVDFVAKSGESLSGLIDYQRREKDGGRRDGAGHQFSILLASHWEKLLLGAIVGQSKSHLFCGQRRRFAKRIFFSRRDPIVTANFTASGLKNLRLCMRKRPLIKTEDCAFSLLSLLHFKPIHIPGFRPGAMYGTKKGGGKHTTSVEFWGASTTFSRFFFSLFRGVIGKECAPSSFLLLLLLHTPASSSFHLPPFLGDINETGEKNEKQKEIPETA